jgi:hypothetical protein
VSNETISNQKHPLRTTLRWAWLVVAVAILLIVYLSATGSPQPAGPPVFIEQYPAYARQRVTLQDGAKPLGEVLGNLAAQVKLPLDALWPAATSTEPALRAAPILLNGGSYELKDALLLVQHAASALSPKDHFEFELDEDRIVAGPASLVYNNDRAETCVYPLGDFLRSRSPWIDSTTHEGSMARIKDVIRMTIQPDQWRDNGGLLGTIADAGDRLVITATPGMHWQIKQLLDSLLKP